MSKYLHGVVPRKNFRLTSGCRLSFSSSYQNAGKNCRLRRNFAAICDVSECCMWLFRSTLGHGFDIICRSKKGWKQAMQTGWVRCLFLMPPDDGLLDLGFRLSLNSFEHFNVNGKEKKMKKK